jgi:glycosyltransferase involved in cell wall biosynthesis
MKILYHHRTRGEDAQGIHIKEIIRGMRDLGHDVKVSALTGESHLAAVKPVSGGGVKPGKKEKESPVMYELMTLAYNAYGLGILIRAAMSFRPDMIYERYSLNTFCGVLVARLFRIPFILEVNAPLSYERRKYEGLAFPSLAIGMERWICSRAHRTIVVSNVMKEMLMRIGVPAEKMVVFHNGIDPEEYNPALPGDAVRERYGLKEKVVLGFVGWFKKWHGLEMLVELCAEEKWGEKGVHLLLVGDGPAQGDLAENVSSLGVSRYVTFTGPVPRSQMPQFVAAFDIALQPMVTEYASPMKIFEYMGMEKCIVAPDQPNIREILTDGKTGLLFRPGDKEELRAALRKAISQVERRADLGRNARQAIFEHCYIWRSNAKRAVELAFGEQVHG